MTDLLKMHKEMVMASFEKGLTETFTNRPAILESKVRPPSQQKLALGDGPLGASCLVVPSPWDHDPVPLSSGPIRSEARARSWTTPLERRPCG